MQLVKICSKSRARTNAKDARENAKSANVSAREKETPVGDDHRERQRRTQGGEFGLDWFAFTSAIRFGQGRYSGHFHPTNNDARDVVQVACQ